MKWLKLACAVLLVVLLILAVAPLPVFAIANPLTPPSVNAVNVYEFADGSIGVLIEYYLDYVAPFPAETATESYLGVFIDTDGTTQLKSVAPYTFQASGYEGGLIWIPFTAAEVATYSIDSVDVALYRVWLTGNPTVASGWTGDPPKTIAIIDDWHDTGDMSVILGLAILNYADDLELAWGLDLIQETPLGSRLTVTGESYFLNVITNLRDLAPNVFSSGEYQPVQEDIDYSTQFGATATSAILAGSPVTLAEGVNNLTSTGAGTIIFELEKGTEGTVTGAVIAGSPVTIRAGTNTITTTGAGAFTATVNLVNTATSLANMVIGTAFDLTDVATAFGMSRWMFSGILWIIISVIICAGTYRMAGSGEAVSGGSESKAVMVVFNFCIIGGALLGLLHIVVAVLMFIASIVVTGYVLFYQKASV